MDRRPRRRKLGRRWLGRRKVDSRRRGRQAGPMIPFPNISPEVFSFTVGGMTFSLRWYALAYIVGILIGWRLAAMALRRPAIWGGRAPMTPADLEGLLSWVILGVIAGGRLGYVLFYRPFHFLENPWEIPAIWLGGMSFHGGFLGVVLAVLVYSRRHGLPLGGVADAIALATPPAILLGRIANFINAELWGRPTTLPWGVIFPGEAAQHCPGFPSPCARHPSQLYEGALEGLLLGLLLVLLAFRWGGLARPWLVTGVFLAGYGLSRFLVEFLRQPDAQFVGPGNPFGLVLHWQGWGLTMGQVLTLPMIVVGLWLILRVGRRPALA
jgi:phosphatidylglycerol:prolipoprotein diacylglycerol transferase